VEAYYGFAVEAAAPIASDAALIAEEASEAAIAPVAASEAIGAGAAAAGSAAAGGASVLLPQALRTNAAAIAQMLSLVFIYRYPK
jgi:hypothetical protein